MYATYILKEKQAINKTVSFMKKEHSNTATQQHSNTAKQQHNNTTTNRKENGVFSIKESYKKHE